MTAKTTKAKIRTLLKRKGWGTRRKNLRAPANAVGSPELQKSKNLHIHGHDGADFYESAGFEDGAAEGKLGGVGQVLGLDDGVAANNVLRLGVGAVGDDLALLDDFAAAVERIAGFLMWPWSPNSFIQAIHFCMVFCICSGDAGDPGPARRDTSKRIRS